MTRYNKGDVILVPWLVTKILGRFSSKDLSTLGKALKELFDLR